MTWEEAKVYCENLGGHLITITSNEEQSFVEQTLLHAGKQLYYWIGATDLEKKGAWKWITGEEWSYTNWKLGEPNNSYNNEDYLMIYKSTYFGKWNDLDVNASRYYGLKNFGFICEWETNGINSISPVDGSVLSENPTFSVSADSAEQLADCSVYYRAAGFGEWTIIENKTLSENHIVFRFTWNTENIASGKYDVKFVVTESNGREYVKIYTYNLQADKPSAAVLEGNQGNLAVNLSWSNPDEDISYYKIYRSRTGEDYRYLGKTETTNYVDKNLSSEITYNYYVVSVNKYGNSSKSNVVSVKPNFVDRIAPKANAGLDTTGIIGEEISFIGSNSTDNVGIVSYLWDFGDGETSNEANPVHIYSKVKDEINKDYNYTVTLTVADEAGNTSTDTVTVSVYPKEQTGILNITVKDKNGRVIPDAYVYADFADGTNKYYFTDTRGKVRIAAMAGNYNFSAYKQGYLPNEDNFAVVQYKQTNAEIILESGEVVTADTSVKPMTRDEIVDAGIDVTDPDNQYVYEIETKLVFDDEEIEMPKTVVSGGGTVHSGGGVVHYGGSGGSSGSTGGGTSSSKKDEGIIVPQIVVNEKHPEIPPTVAYLVIPSTVSWLKEFFNVYMVIDNQALPQFVIENAEVTLELPEGLTLAQIAEEQSLNIKLGDIEGQQNAKAEWIVRGDVSGTYNLSAAFKGVMMPFEADVEANFTTQDAITVYGEKALKVAIYPEDTAFIGGKYYIDYVLKNQSNKPLYDFSINFGMESEDKANGHIYKLETESDQTYLPYLHAGDTLAVAELSPGEEIRGTYETVINFDGDPDEVYYRLIGTMISFPNEELENVPIDVIPVQSSSVTANAIGGATYTQDLGTLSGQETMPITLVYNSMLGSTGDFGCGWLFNYYYKIEKENNKYVLINPNGLKYYFSPDYSVKGELTDNEVTVNVNSMILNGITPITRGSRNYTFEVLSDGYKVTTGDNTVLTFDSEGYVTDVEDKTGYGISVSRTSEGFVLTEDNSGNALTAHMNDDGYIDSITDTTGTFGFNYDGDMLKSVTTPDNGKTEFEYTDNMLTGITRYNTANGTSTRYTNEYDENGYLIKTIDGMGNAKTYNYNNTAEFWRIIVDETNRLGYHNIRKFNRFGELVSYENELGSTTYYTYDADGNLASVIDPNENTIIYAYDDKDNLISITDAEGNSTVYTYDDNNNRTSETDANGNTVSYVYNDKNLLTSTTDKNGNVTAYTYDEYGNMLAVSSNGVTSKNTYEDCLLKTSTDFNGNTTVYNYTDWVLTSTTDAKGGTTSYDYDDYMRLSKVTYPDGTSEEWYYNCLGNLEVYTDRNGNSTAYGYNDNNDRTKVTAGYVKNGANDIVTLYEYDEEEQLTKVTDFDNNTTSYEYDAAGQLVKSTDGNNNITEYTYDKAGRLLSEAKGGSINKYTYYKTGELNTVTDSLNNTTRYSYDKIGNLTAVRDALNNLTSYEYDNNGNMLKVTTPEGFTNEYTYDFRNNVSTFTDANGNKAEYTYDNNGNKTKETYNNDISVSYAYDELNRLTSVADANGSITRYAYDKAGNVTNAVTPTGIKTRFTYDGSGNVKQVYDSNDTLVQSTDYDLWNNPMRVKDALGNTTSYNYNSTGKLLSYTTPRGNEYKYTYDGNGNMLTETDPMDGVVGYEYNAFDTAASFTDANGNKTAYEYDLLNRLISETSATGDSDNYTYDAVSNLTAYTNKRGQNIDYTYDKDGRMTNRTTVEGATAYTYDNNSNLLTVTDNNGTISRTYDNLNRVTSYTNANGDTIGYEYDNVGNLTKLTYPDSKEVTYTYNANNQMTSVTDWNGHKTTYAYDENGRLSKISRPDGSTKTYTYNVIGQLTKEVDTAKDGTIINEYNYAYDADGNIVTENSANEPMPTDFGINNADMQYGLANQLNSFNGTPISYDKDGNMLNTPLGDKWGTLTYDSLNYLTDITTSGGVISYDYDAEGYRTLKTEYNITTSYVVNPNAELSQVLTSTTNGETTYYVYGLGLVSQENSEGYKLYHYDYRGSTTAITDLNGTVTDTVYYDPYGNVVKRSGTTETPFLYVGKYGVETDTNGLYYMRARYYNPTIQRFINVDPIRDGYNWYGYVSGNPIIYIDVLGKEVNGVGIAGSVGFFFGGSYAQYIVNDSHGNQGILETKVYGLYFDASVASSGFTYEDLDTIFELEGTGVSIGGSFSAVGGSVEAGNGEVGGSISASIGAPASFHVGVSISKLIQVW